MKQYPIAEIFDSPQGEGQWAGTMMTFIRFAGCNVGKPWLTGERSKHNIEAPYQEKCTLWNGKTFPCDTDYRVKERMSEAYIGDLILDKRRVVLTGGEPLMHDLVPLLEVLRDKHCFIHVETSGTIPLNQILAFRGITWITISPKMGCLDENLEFADEIKILVGPDFAMDAFRDRFGSHLRKVWLQPINGLATLDKANLAYCVELQKHYPQVRLSVQLHKILGVR